MKKLIVVFSALFALLACTKESPVVEEPQLEGSEGIKVNLTINRNDINDATKAAVKTGWAVDDVVFIFFAYTFTSEDAKYLELKWNGSTWDSALKNNLTSANITYWANKSSAAKLTAVYLPYGSGYTVKKKGTGGGAGSIIVNEYDEKYSGHFYYFESDDAHTGFSFEGGVLSGSISLSAPVPASGVLVHYDISGGFDSDNTSYVLNQDYMRALTLDNIGYTGGITQTVSQTMGVGIPGYYDADPNGDGKTTDAIMSFSGVLDESAVGESLKYRFVIHDKANKKAYSRVVKDNRTISGNMYVGIGNIGDSPWNCITEPYFSVSPTKLVTFAPANLVYAAGTWKFHVNEYDCCFLSTDNGGSYTDGQDIEGMFGSGNTFDLFGWASTGWSGGAWASYEPWIRGAANNTYGPSGDITGTKGDWGVYCAIKSADEKTTYVPNTWRLLTGGFSNEVCYLLYDSSQSATKYPSRNDVSQLSSLGTVNGVKGFIILADNFSDPKLNSAAGDGSFVGGKIATGALGTDYLYNVYTASDWTTMRSKGAAFLPLTGRSSGTTYSIYATSGYYSGGYWTSSNVGNNTTAYVISFGSQRGTAANDAVGRSQGRPVRLVRDLN